MVVKSRERGLTHFIIYFIVIIESLFIERYCMGKHFIELPCKEQARLLARLRYHLKKCCDSKEVAESLAIARVSKVSDILSVIQDLKSL